MGFDSLRFYQFRNVMDQAVSLRSDTGVAREIFLTGPNGQGKTNFLEGIYLLAYGSSFRTKLDRKLCRHGKQEFSLLAEGDFGGLRTQWQIKLQDGKKSIFVDGSPVADRRDLLRRLPCIAFTHEDFQFVSGAPEFQRLFFDQSLSLFDVRYVDTLRRYRKMLRSRNALLAENLDTRVLEVYEEQLVSAGLELMRSRQEVIKLFQPTFSALFAQVSGVTEGCLLRYQPSWKSVEPTLLAEQLVDRRDADRRLGFTSSGPHRDRYGFSVDGRNFADHASTGQIRLMSLLLRVVQAQLAYQQTGQRPLLLIDDVLLELDGAKRQAILNLLPPFEQAFFTFLPDERLEPSGAQNPLWLEVRDGTYHRAEGAHGR
jgi:DNA replication and repair protein RecF